MIKEETRCLLCGEKAEFKMKKRGYQEPDVYDIYYCESCNTSFSLPRVATDSIYQLIYEKGDKVSGYDRYWRYFRDVKDCENPIDYLINSEEVYWGAYSAIVNNLKLSKNANILEIGSGLGYFTYSLYKEGFKSIKGLEISQEAVDQATASFGPLYICTDVYEFAEENAGRYDAIILTEVIEHIEDPLKFTKVLSLLLKEGGGIIMTTPNKSFYPLFTNWETDLPPVHCWWFSENSLEYVAEKLSMSVSFVDFVDYYKKHEKKVFNKDLFNGESAHLFDVNGNILSVDSNKNYEILPKWLKKNRCYRKIKSFIYPIFSNKYIVTNHRSSVLCAIFVK